MEFISYFCQKEIIMFIAIPSNIFNGELKSWLRGEQLKEPKSPEIIFLEKVLSAHLDDTHLRNKARFIGSIKLTDDERELIKKNNWLESENVELRARFTDLTLRHIKGSHKLKVMKHCSDDYLTVFDQTHHRDYLIRAARVCTAKEIYDSDFVNRVVNNIICYDINPYWAFIILKQIINNTPKAVRNNVLSLLNNHFRKRAENDLNYADNYIDFLKETNQLDNNEYNRAKALNYESIANRIINNQKPNTFYPSIQDNYEQAHHFAYLCRSKYPDDYKRIKADYEKANQEFVTILTTYGVRSEYRIDSDLQKNIDSDIPNIVIHDYIDALNIIVNAPLYTADNRLISELKTEIAQNECLKAMASTINLDEKGHVIGTAPIYDYPILEAHIRIRQYSVYMMTRIAQYIQEAHLDFDEDNIVKLLIVQKPEYVDEDDLTYWNLAITTALKNDYITAIHIIVPQFEKALRNIASSKVDTVHLENKRQDEHNLYKVLQDLKPFMSNELNNELVYFLTSGCDVNFRNRLMHGLIKPFEILRYGPYMICLALKLFFDPNFIIPSDE